MSTAPTVLSCVTVVVSLHTVPRSRVFSLLHPGCHRSARRCGALCAPETLAGGSKGLETPFVGIRHCESCVRVSVDEGIALSHETFTLCVPRLPTARQTHFLCCRSHPAKNFFAGLRPCTLLRGSRGLRPQAGEESKGGSGEKTLFFSPLLRFHTALIVPLSR